jgi:O-antigen/teichoic acid export membrane protein
VSDEAETPAGSFGLRRLSKGALIYTISNGLQSATSVIVMPLLFSHLSVGAYGEYGLLQSFLTIALALVVLGMDSAVGRMFFDAPDIEGRRRIMGTLLPLQCLLTLGLTLALDFSVAATITSIAGIAYHPVIRLTLWTAAATAVFNSVAAFWRSGERPLRVAVANFASFGCTVAGIAYFLIVREMGLTGVMLGYLTGRFSFNSWASGEMVVPEAALPHMAKEGISFIV